MLLSVHIGAASRSLFFFSAAVAIAVAACAWDWTVVPNVQPNAEAGDAGAETDWYVSVNGNDANDGSRERPVRSLGRALELARSDVARQGIRRIAVCKGEYPEGRLTIQGALEVGGNYDCISWTRPPPATLALKPDSLLTNLDTADVFMSVEGNATGTPRVDQLSITVSRAPIAVGIVGDAALANVAITNTTLPQNEQPTVAVGVTRGKLTLERSLLTVDLGAATTGPASAVGAAIGVLEGSQLTARANVMTVSRVRGLGVGLLLSDSAADLEDNVAVVLNCTKGASTARLAAAMGLDSTNATIKSKRNTFLIDVPDFVDDRADTSTPVNTATNVVGVNLARRGGTASLDSDSDRVIAPKVLGTGATALTFQGFILGAGARVTNATILVDSRSYAIGGTLGTTGITVTSPQAAVVVAHNTLYFSETQPGTDNSAKYALLVDGAGSSQVTFEGNLALTANGGVFGMTFLRIDDCASSGITKLANNRFGGFRSATRVPGSDAGCPLETFDGDAGTNAALTCTGTCAEQLETLSIKQFENDPLRPAKPAACPGMLVPVTASTLTDATGKTRSDVRTTAGAVEIDCN
jgi:hypothetical protein